MNQTIKPPVRSAMTAPGSQATQIEQVRAIAEVQAMVVVARNSPRSQAQAREAVIETCNQMRLAERAFFRFPRGGQNLTGPSIHLAVELARCWGNVTYGVKELARNDGTGESEMCAFAWDLQTNTRAETTFIVPHMRDKKGGPERLTDMRDIYENNANNAARRLREMIFRIIPPWLKQEAEETCRATLERGESDKTMAQRIAEALRAFSSIGVSRERVERRLGGSADTMTPVDLAGLRVVFTSIKNGEVSVHDEFPIEAPESPPVSRMEALETALTAATPANDPPPADPAPADPAPPAPAPAPTENMSQADLMTMADEESQRGVRRSGGR